MPLLRQVPRGYICILAGPTVSDSFGTCTYRYTPRKYLYKHGTYSFVGAQLARLGALYPWPAQFASGSGYDGCSGCEP